MNPTHLLLQRIANLEDQKRQAEALFHQASGALALARQLLVDLSPSTSPAAEPASTNSPVSPENPAA